MKIVLAYSGGLDTSAIIPWLKDNYENAEIYAFVADVGQEKSEFDGIEQKAKQSGAISCEIVDLKQEFVQDFIYPSMQAGAIYEGAYLLGTSMARPVISKAIVEYARKIGADAIAHGATGKGNDQVRFEYSIKALAPELKIIAPWRIWDKKSRSDLLDFLASKNIPCSASREKIYSKDANLWHVSCEGGVLEKTENEYDENAFSSDLFACSDQPQKFTLTFEKGYISAIDGEKIDLVNGILKLNEIGKAHAIGRLDLVENRLVGLKSRGCYETPGGTILYKALRALEELTLDRDSRKIREQIALELGYLIYDGKWFCPARAALMAAASVFSQNLSGEVVVRVYKGNCEILSKKSPNSLYSEEFVTFEEDEVYSQKDADGFINLFSLSAKIRALKGLK